MLFLCKICEKFDYFVLILPFTQHSSVSCATFNCDGGGSHLSRN